MKLLFPSLIVALLLIISPALAQTFITTQNNDAIYTGIYRGLMRDSDNNIWAILYKYPNIELYKSANKGLNWINTANYSFECAIFPPYYLDSIIVNDVIYATTNYASTTFIQGYNIKNNSFFGCNQLGMTAGSLTSLNNKLYVVGRDEYIDGHIIVREFSLNLSEYTDYHKYGTDFELYDYPQARVIPKNTTTLGILTFSSTSGENDYVEFNTITKTFSAITDLDEIFGNYVLSSNAITSMNNEIYFIAKYNGYGFLGSNFIAKYNGTWNLLKTFNNSFDYIYPSSILKTENNLYALLNGYDKLTLYSYSNDTYLNLFYAENQTYNGQLIKSKDGLDIIFGYSDTDSVYYYFYKTEQQEQEKPIYSGVLVILGLVLLVGFIFVIINLIDASSSIEDIINLLIIALIGISLLIIALKFL